MYWEAMRTPALPGENDVTNGSVDYYDTDWENVDNSALEEEMQKSRVVVTGMGAITPIGLTVEEFWENVKVQKVGIGAITKFDTTDFKVKLAAEVKGFDAQAYSGF